MFHPSLAGAQSTNARLLSRGSKERSMANLSLARIMFGTNEDLHASQPASVPGSPSLAAEPANKNLSETSVTSEPGALGEVLRKAWTNLTRRH
jgi:hypothetical protein